MTERIKKRRKLSLEILSVFAVCLVLSLMLLTFLFFFTVTAVEEYCYYNDIPLEEEDLYGLDNVVLNIGLIVSAGFFVIMFFVLFGEKLSYVRTITGGVAALQRGEFGSKVELKGNNELTQLAEAVNYLSETEQKIKEKEKRLNEEKEELIRTLSHDIRTPLTSVMSYTELIASKESLTIDEQREYLELVRKKTAQIKDLTDILLDGGRRDTEYFEDGRLLFEQLAGEFEDLLEESFSLSTDLSRLPEFSGCFDAREMRRIFDNLISNVRKYADDANDIVLSIEKNERGIVIRQNNTVKKNIPTTESYRMGINSIRRIVQNYDGSVEINTEIADNFEIIITLSKF